MYTLGFGMTKGRCEDDMKMGHLLTNPFLFFDKLSDRVPYNNASRSQVISFLASSLEKFW